MKKDFLFVAVLIFAVILLSQGIKIQSVEEYYNEHLDEITEDSETVFITIECRTVLDNMDDLEVGLIEHVPEDGIILERLEVKLRDGDTAFDILQRVTRVKKIHMECIYTPNYSSNYVQGINHLYEFSCGELSGWMYSVNGSFPGYGCSKYQLRDGDELEWRYTCDLGRDLGGSVV